MNRSDFLEGLTSKMPPNIYEKINSKKIAIAGLGGLGSNIAVSLVRSGIDKLILCDFDKVELSNLARQYYFYEDIGRFKVDALCDILKRINPFIKLEAHNVFLSEDNYDEIFKGADLVVEALDNANSKEKLVSYFLKKNKILFSGVGMAGTYSANIIKTKKLGDNLYFSGDFKNEANDENGLLASRVSIVANHQANMIIRYLLGKKEC